METLTKNKQHEHHLASSITIKKGIFIKKNIITIKLLINRHIIKNIIKNQLYLYKPTTKKSNR